MSNLLKKAIFVFLFLSIGTCVVAQEIPPPPTPGGSFPGLVVPIDTYISYSIFLGIGIGILLFSRKSLKLK